MAGITRENIDAQTDILKDTFPDINLVLKNLGIGNGTAPSYETAGIVQALANKLQYNLDTGKATLTGDLDINGVVGGTAVSTTGGASKLLKSDTSENLTLTGGLTAGGTIQGSYAGFGIAPNNNFGLYVDGTSRPSDIARFVQAGTSIGISANSTNGYIGTVDAKDFNIVRGGVPVATFSATTLTLTVGLTAVLPTYADNADAISGGLVATNMYKTATGEVRIV